MGSCHRQHRRLQHAFTLVEMMIVVLIIAIAGALAVARLGHTSLTKLRAAANVLAADLNYAQVESIAHTDAPRVIVLNAATSTYHLAVASAPDTPITHPINKAPYTVTFGQGASASLQGVTLASTTIGDDQRLGFGAYGQLDQTTTATIVLACEGSTITLTINPVSGEVTIGDVSQ